MGLTFAACGDDAAPSPDAAPGPRHRLEILDPPGDQIGLAFLASEALRVRLYDEQERPLSGHAVSFALDPDTDAVGSTLSASQAPTDPDGVATVDVLSGGARANFRVEVTAAEALPVLFYVAVSDVGFARLTVLPRHEGTRPPGHFDGVEARLYPGRQCALLDANAPPPSVYPPRQASAFDQPLLFTAVAGQEPHSILAWGRTAAGVVLAEGCLELDGELVRAGDVFLEMPVADKLAALGDYEIATMLDTGTLAAAALPPLHPWRLAACADGPGQIVLEAALARLPAGPVKDALTLARGTADPTGCRAGGIDADVAGALDAADFAAAAAALPALLDALYLTSVFRTDGAVADHRLESVAVDVGGGDLFVEDAVASSRPVIEAVGVPLTILPGVVLIADHSVTLRPAWTFRRAFEEGVLATAGLPALDDLAAAMVGAASGAGGATGCAAVSEAACLAAAQPNDCLAAACQAAVADLGAALAAPFAAMDATGLDLTWRGQARAVDDDLDLDVEELGMGLWSGEVTLADGSTAGVTGLFTGTP